MRPFLLTQTFLFVHATTKPLGSWTKCAKYLQFPPWLIPNSMRKGVGQGEGEGSDLENFWAELSPPSPLSPASPVLPNQLLLAVRRPPMISSSKADVVLGVGVWDVGGWEGDAWGKGEERGPANGFDQNAALRKV